MKAWLGLQCICDSDRMEGISRHLRFGVRTVQRWQDEGLPVQRISNSRRSPVVADSERLDAWVLHRNLPPGAPPTLLEKRERLRESSSQ
jgi:hypothetical protein